MSQLGLWDKPKPGPVVLTSSVTPRDYQAIAHTNTFREFAEGTEGVLARMPTGSGKTLLACMIADTWLQQHKHNRVIVICHENQLMHQFRDELESYFRDYVPIEQGPNVVHDIPQIVVASRATLLRRERKYEGGKTVKESRLWKFDPDLNWLVIFDECHRYANHLKSVQHIVGWFSSNPNSKRLGLSATPERGDKVSLETLFPAVAYDYRLSSVDGEPNAVDDGWAVPYEQHFVTVEGVDFKNLKEIANEFDPLYLEQVLAERETLMRLVKPTLDLVGDRRTLIFSPTVYMADAVAKTINGETSRRSARCLHGKIPHEVRGMVYRDFQAGEFQFLSVCGLCREGYNDKDLGAVAVFRPTKSRTLAEQMKGRGCRPGRGVVDGRKAATWTAEQRKAAIAASHKPTCMIIDLVGITGLADCASTASILSAGEPDAVIERANRIAMAAEDGADMIDAIKEARVQVRQEEREEKQRQAQERDRLRQEEYDRRARLAVDVDYWDQKVPQAHGYATDQPRKGARCIWGQFKGALVADVPTWYLRCVIKHGIFEKKPWLQGAVAKELKARGH